MTQLTITPKVADKTARFKGTIAAGEHVAVAIKGGAEWIGTDSGANLTLRVLDLVTGRTLAVFPYWTEDNQEDWPDDVTSADAWETSGDDNADLSCTLNLNTLRMVAAARHMLRVPVLFVLGDTDDPRTLYFRDRYEVEYWPERIGDTVPYDLDKWPKKIDDWTELVSDWTARLDGMKLSATRESSPASGNPYVEITLNDGTAESDTKVKVYDGEVSTSAMNTAISAMGNTKVDKTTTVNGHELSDDVTVTKADVGLGDVVNTGDSATPVSGGTTKFTTGGAYTELAKKADKVANATSGNFAGLNTSGNLKDSGKKASDFATALSVTSLEGSVSSLGGRVTAVEDVVPSTASSSNKLADIAFVNSSISTNTANYISDNGEPFESTIALNAYSGTKTNNDYAFVVGTDSAGNTTYTRYKWDGSQWAEEYVLNNSSFTSAQWAAISSGITSSGVTKLNGIEPGAEVNVIESVKVNGTALTPSNKAVDVTVPTVDATLAVQGAAADAKAVGDALAGKLDGAATYPAWDEYYPSYSQGSIVSYNGRLYKATSETFMGVEPTAQGSGWSETTIDELKQDTLSSQQIGYINSVPNKADKAVPSAAGNLASLTATGNLADSGAKASDFALAADLPYRLVEPGKWEFGGLSEDATGADMSYDNGYWTLYIYYDGETDRFTAQGSENDLVVVFSDASPTATRASLPGHLCDRSGNRVVVSGDTTLTLPAAVPGYLRDFLVRLEISGSTVPTITFAAPTGETITYETDGDEFPVPDEAGDWLYSFTESCVQHKFAVALKKVNEVAAPQAQGGS